MKLHAALGASLLFTKGAIPAAGQACTAALDLAELLGDAEYQLRALWGLWTHHTNSGEHAPLSPWPKDFIPSRWSMPTRRPCRSPIG